MYLVSPIEKYPFMLRTSELFLSIESRAKLLVVPQATGFEDMWEGKKSFECEESVKAGCFSCWIQGISGGDIGMENEIDREHGIPIRPRVGELVSQHSHVEGLRLKPDLQRQLDG
jgi:hypothetical protein